MGSTRTSATARCCATARSPAATISIKINEAAPNVTVEFNEFYGTFGHPPISLTGAPGLLFRGNFGHDWNTGGNGAVQLKGGSHDVLFDGNRFQDITSDAGTIAMGDGCDSTCDIDPNHFAAVRVHAINNVMVRVGRGFDVQGCQDCDVLSNTIVDSGTGNVIFKLTSATTNGTTHDSVNVRILDNLIASSSGNLGDVIQINGASGTGLQLDYNLAWNNGQPVSWGSSPSVGGRHALGDGDPKLTAASAGDFTPAAGTPRSAPAPTCSPTCRTTSWARRGRRAAPSTSAPTSRTDRQRQSHRTVQRQSH